MLEAAENVHAQLIEVALESDSVVDEALHLFLASFKALAKKGVKFQLFINQDYAKIDILHSGANGPEIGLQLAFLHLGAGLDKFSLAVACSAVPNLLAEFSHETILVVRDIEFYSRHLERHFDNLRLPRGFSGDVQLRKPGESRILEIKSLGLFNKGHFVDLRIIPDRQSDALVQSCLGHCRIAGANCNQRCTEIFKQMFHTCNTLSSIIIYYFVSPQLTTSFLYVSPPRSH